MVDAPAAESEPEPALPEGVCDACAKATVVVPSTATPFVAKLTVAELIVAAALPSVRVLDPTMASVRVRPEVVRVVGYAVIIAPESVTRASLRVALLDWAACMFSLA